MKCVICRTSTRSRLKIIQYPKSLKIRKMILSLLKKLMSKGVVHSILIYFPFINLSATIIYITGSTNSICFYFPALDGSTILKVSNQTNDFGSRDLKISISFFFWQSCELLCIFQVVMWQKETIVAFGK